MVQVMVIEPPIKMDTPDWIPLIVIPVLVYGTCHVANNECAYVPLHSGGLLQVVFA